LKYKIKSNYVIKRKSKVQSASLQGPARDTEGRRVDYKKNPGVSLTKIHMMGYQAISTIRSQIDDQDQIPRMSARARVHSERWQVGSG
jgi:hypothetical protein